MLAVSCSTASLALLNLRPRRLLRTRVSQVARHAGRTTCRACSTHKRQNNKMPAVERELRSCGCISPLIVSHIIWSNHNCLRHGHADKKGRGAVDEPNPLFQASKQRQLIEQRLWTEQSADCDTSLRRRYQTTRRRCAIMACPVWGYRRCAL